MFAQEGYLEVHSLWTFARNANASELSMNDDELKLAQGLLQDLKQEADRLDGLMDEMITEMEATPPVERSGERWDAFTKHFLELQAAQRTLGDKLKRANIALANSDKTTRQ